MTDKEAVEILQANIGKPVHISYVSGGGMSVIIECVDDEGFLYKNVAGPTTDVPRAATLATLDGKFYWTRFEELAKLVTISN